jgi:signal transduction histidine kinase
MSGPHDLLGESRARLFAAISHDLRQGVHALALHLDPLVALHKVAGDASTQHAIRAIRESCQMLDHLLSQVLDLTRLDSAAMEPDLQPVEVAPVVRSLLIRFSAAAEHAGTRMVMLVRPARYVRADKLMLQRVLSNLLDNAISASPRGASVVLALRPSGDAWRVQVRDSGIGIAMGSQERIFEEYAQLDTRQRGASCGLGLGLAIARRLTLLMGGSLAVQSAPGRGCCMTLTLPKACYAGDLAGAVAK